MTTSPIKYAFIPRVDTRLGWDLAKLLHKQGYRIVAHAQTQARQHFVNTQLRRHVPEIELTCYRANLQNVQEVFWLTRMLTENIPHFNCVIWPLVSLNQSNNKETHYQENVHAFYLLLSGLIRNRKSDTMQIIQIACSGANWQPFASITKHSSDIGLHSDHNIAVFSHLQQRYANQATVASYLIPSPYIKQTENLVIDELNNKPIWWQQILRATENRPITKITTAVEAILASQPTSNEVYDYQSCYSTLGWSGYLTPRAINQKNVTEIANDLATKLRIE